MDWHGGQKVGRHAKRDVERIEIEDEGAIIRLFLKRERQTYLKDRIRNWVTGLGWGTKSRREWHVLHAMSEAGVGCAEPLVFGERRGFRPQGYLVLREITHTMLLCPYLAERASRMTIAQRRRLAMHLGREVSRLHAAGIDHPDLFSKHVLLSTEGTACEPPRVWFIDMQRSATQPQLSQVQRVQDLAALDSTVHPNLASHSDRLAFLRSYLAAGPRSTDIRRLAQLIRRRARKLQVRRKIRDMRDAFGGESAG
jgi:tRNA A-37 threonylcarbamoyl transferase component Bud32